MLPAFVAAEAGLAFLGIGVTGGAVVGPDDRPTPCRYFEQLPALPLGAPDRRSSLLVLALNLLGDAIRDALDPKTRR